jgi:hypothetical protein
MVIINSRPKSFDNQILYGGQSVNYPFLKNKQPSLSKPNGIFAATTA